MKTLMITAEDAIVEKIAGILDLLPKLHYEMIFPSQTEEDSQKSHPLSLKRGAAKNIVTYIADDFDAPLADFEEYMS